MPEDEFKRDSKIVVNLKKGFPALEGHLGMKKSSKFYFTTYYKFKFTGETIQEIMPMNYRWCDVLSLVFTNPVEYRELYKHLEFKPFVIIPHESVAHTPWNTHKFCLSLGFKPETKYKLFIDEDLKDIFGQELGEDIEIEFTVGSYLPQFSLPSGMGIIEAYEGRKVPVTLINPEDIIINSRMLKKQEIIPFLLAKKYFYIPYELRHKYKHVKKFEKDYYKDKETDYKPKFIRNKNQITPLHLSPLLKGKPYGFLDLNLTGTYHYKSTEYNTFMQITDMGITGKFSAETNLLLVTDLKKARLIKGAAIEIRDDYNKVLWKGKTDKHGMVKTPGWLNLGLNKYSYSAVRQWAFAKKGKDTVFINNEWGTGVDPWRFNIWSNPNINYPYYNGSITSERGLYRPGEKVHFKGVLREKICGDWTISPVKKLQYSIKDSRYNEVKKGTVKINKFGSFAFDFKISKDAPTGYYSIKLFQKEKKDKKSKIKPRKERKLKPKKGKVDIYGSFRVEVFQPVQFDVRIWFEEKEYFLDDTVDFKVTGWYLFGAPMSDKKVHYTVTGAETFFTPPGNPGFRFSRMQWLDDKYYYSRVKRMASKTTKLNKKGELKVSIPLFIDEDVHALNVNIESTVYGEDQQRVSGRASLLVHGSDFYIGIKREKYFIEKGKKAYFEIITVSPDGKRRQGDDINIKVYRRYWESVRKAGVGGRYFWESEKVDKLIEKEKITTKKKGRRFSFTPKKTGLYFIKAVSEGHKDKKVRADDYIYSVGEGYSPWLMSDDDRIELVPDKTGCKPGDTVRVLVKSPYNKCTALITVEREFVMDSWVEQLKGTAAVVEIPVKKEYLPNIFVCVSLIKGRVEDSSYTNHGMDLGKPCFKIGYCKIDVSPGERHLTVDIKKSHHTRAPGEPLEVSFQVKNKKGRGVYSECMVAVCDVGVLNLIGFKTPDFFNSFYGPRPLGVMTSDTRLHIIGQRNYGEKGENRGGGGVMSRQKSKKNGGMDMDLFSFRKNFLSTAFYKASIITDKKGRGKVKFNLPDNLTTFRIMVSALTKKSLFGAGDDKVVVKKYLMLKSTIPQFAIVGDEFKAGAVVYNYTEKDTTIKVKLECKGAVVKGKNLKKVFVKKGESADVRFNINCNKVSKVKVKIAAKTGKFKDAIEKSFNVKVPRLVESVALFESTIKDKNFQKIIIPTKDEVFPGAGNLEIALSPSAFSGLKNGIDYLLEYPYGCLEQKISKVLPIVLSKKLILELNLTIYKKNELDRLVKDVIKDIHSFQMYNGGFSYWTSKHWASPWLSAYACFFMIKAEKEGYKIDKKILKHTLNYLADYARSNYKRENLPYSIYCHLSTRAYITYVLALGGKGNKTLINDLYKNIDKIPLFGKANLLKALYHTGYNKKYLKEVKQILFNKVKISSTTAHYEDEGLEGLYWIHSSSVRATSAILQAFMETKTKNSINEKVANWLKRSRKKKSRYNNTQENVWAFHAMTDYFKFYEKEKPKFKTDIIVEGKKILSHTFRKRTQPTYVKKFDFSKFSRGKELLLNINRKGKGRLYYGLRMNYAPRELLKSRNEGIKIEKWYETLEGKKIEEPVFKSGKDYVVVIKVKTTQERHFVVLDDPIPAGFKILNLSFQTESREAYKGVKKTDRWWGSFNHFENYEDKVLAFADSLYYGDHTYRYVIRAVTPGKYLLPPSKIEEMYDPDVFGYYGQQYVTVK